MQEQTQTSLLAYRLSAIEDQIGDLKSETNDIHNKTNQLIDAIIGNQLTNSQGLAQKMEQMEITLIRHEEVLKKVKWFWLGVVSVGSVLALIINLVINLLK